jgi:hypothetical protein
MRRIVLGLAACFSLAGSVIAHAQDKPAAVPFDEAATNSAIATATERARQMFLYDQAAWHATDQFQQDWGDRPTTPLRGYLVVPGENGRLATIFYGESDGALAEFARYDISEGKVAGGGLHPDGSRPVLSETARRMVSAREAALALASKENFALCSRSPPNMLVLPPDQVGEIAVYILTPPMEQESYPMGGHFRIDVDPAGSVIRSRPFMKSCFPANYGTTSEGLKPELVGVTHLLDPQPTEVHLFASYYVPVALMIMTVENERWWGIVGGRVIEGGSIADFDAAED